MRVLRLLMSVVLLISGLTGLAVVASGPAVAAQSGGTELTSAYSVYPRVIRLQHSGVADGELRASTVMEQNGAWVGAIWRSTDGGQSFSQIGAVDDPLASGGMCCHTLYELPITVGALPAGTLLWSASFGADVALASRHMAIRVWDSTDGGVTWSLLSTVFTSPNSGGVWEPELTTSSDGHLVAFYSDESDQPTYSQRLIEWRSTDGVTWTDPTNVVASSNSGDRPGMANVRIMPNGQYLMSYEICGPTYSCAVHVRTSADGWNWGDPTTMGAAVATADGEWAASTPTLTVAGTTLLVHASTTHNADGTLASDAGQIVLGNADNGQGPWFRVPAPVTMTDPAADAPPGVGCAGYSNPLLGSADGKSVLELATDVDAGGNCRTYFGSGTVTPIDNVSFYSNSEGSQIFQSTGQLHFVARDAGGNVRHWFQDTSSGTVYRDTWSSGVTVAGEPVSFTYNAQQHVFARDTAGNLQHWFWDPNTPSSIDHDTWGPGANLAYDPAAMVIGEAQHVWGVDHNGNLQHWWWDSASPATVNHNTWPLPAGVPWLAGRPTVMDVNGVQHVFVLDGIGRIVHIWWDAEQGYQSEVIDTGVILVNAPAAAEIGDAQHVWGVDNNGNLQHWWWNPRQGWQHDTWDSTIPVTGRPAFVQNGDTQNVFVRSTTGALEHFWWSPATGMGHDETGSGMASDPNAALLSGTGTIEILGTDGSSNAEHWTWTAPGTYAGQNWGS